MDRVSLFSYFFVCISSLLVEPSLYCRYARRAFREAKLLLELATSCTIIKLTDRSNIIAADESKSTQINEDTV